MSKILFHIGYHKTGTSFLQQNIFEAFPEEFNRVKQREIFNHLIYPDPLEYNRDEAYQFIKSSMAVDKWTVFSNERLSGGLHFGGFDSKEIADRIYDLVPDAKILIGIREQASMIYSTYAQYIRAVGSCSIDEYLNPSTKKNKTLFHYSYLEYHRLVRYYQSLFGITNVLVLPYEILVSDIKNYLKYLFNFLDIEKSEEILNRVKPAIVNRSLTPSSLLIKRYLNPFILKDHLFLGTLLYSRILVFNFRILTKLFSLSLFDHTNKRIKNSMRSRINHVIKGKYSKSNAVTSKIINQNLKCLGYESL